jgi:predicted Zn-dependent protease with MMP-like domain
MQREVFERLVSEALEGLPTDVRGWLDNVAVVVEQRPSAEQLRRAGVGRGGTLFALYEGVPLTQRTHRYGLVLPDKITLFQETIEAVCRSQEDVRRVVRRTVLHELGHHFGLSDERLRELGAY